jgi:DNA-binding phage protein
MRKPKQEAGTPAPIMTRDRHTGGVVVRGRQYTLGEISRGSKVDRPHLTRIFNGKRNPSLATAQRICGFVGVPIEAFLDMLKRG